MMPIFELHIKLRITPRRNNNIIQADGNIRIMYSVISNNFYINSLAGQLIHARSRCSPLKRSSSPQGPLHLVMPISGLHIDLHQLEDEASTP